MTASQTLILHSQLTSLQLPAAEHELMSAQEEMRRLEAVSRKQFAVFYKRRTTECVVASCSETEQMILIKVG